jgi:hypothetical protein
MSHSLLTSALCLALLGTSALAQGKKPASPKKPAVPAPKPKTPKLDPKKIWPAGLEKLAGRYVFVQVASPGGLWQSSAAGREQVSLNELSPEMRRKLTTAEIVISDLKLPTDVEVEERVSPSKRGNLRFYSETARGTLITRNLPGSGGGEETRDYDGPAEFQLDHSAHSNPSAFGVLEQRMRQEATWGVAALDYADLHAIPIQANAKAGEEVDEVLTNARILRSGVEIFAFVSWSEKRADGERSYTGSVRLARVSKEPAPPK